MRYLTGYKPVPRTLREQLMCYAHATRTPKTQFLPTLNSIGIGLSDD
ncbi:MAG: hypothetical protein F6J98_47125 [Moorea sp. SIO4G2]|nr:hypothetical protein [Moorena sp. SIO4G2]